MDYNKCAAEILDAIGGKENLASAAHCATRLRLVIADNAKVKKKVLENIDIPVVIASRTHHGLVTLNESLAPGRICAGRLAPQKAAVLLRLALTQTNRIDEIKRVFML